MQTKFSYRVLKWTMLVGTAASLATACVVTAGDGGGGAGAPDISFGGESSSTSGKTSSGGSSSEAGKTSTGGSSGSSTAGTAGTMTGGEGGAAYVAGQCDADTPTSANEPSCSTATPDKQDCLKCMKAKCCTEWQTCFGDTPTIACGWGPTEKGDGQFDCVQHCFTDNTAGETDADKLLTACAGSCANQCDAADNGNVMQATSDLIGCANDPMNCQAVCFPFN